MLMVKDLMDNLESENLKDKRISEAIKKKAQQNDSTEMIFRQFQGQLPGQSLGQSLGQSGINTPLINIWR